MAIVGKTILVLSNEPWGDIWYSKQNYAYELSKTNQVIFLDPPTRWNLFYFFCFPVAEKKISDSLKVVGYHHVLPYINDFFNRLNNWFVSKRIRQFLQRKGLSKYIFWSFDPIRLYNPVLLDCELSIFHCVDYYYFNHLGERELCKNCDLLFGTSRLFLQNYQAYDQPKHVVPHGISSEEFETDPEVETEIEVPVSDYGLYVGVIDHRLDYELFERIILKFSTTPFVFVGPLRPQMNASYKNIFEEKYYANVYHLGPKHFKTLKYYIKKSSFCLSLMDMNFHMNTVHHHKTLVYLCQGKPVFGFRFEEYKDLDQIMYLSNSGDEIVRMLESFLDSGESDSLKKQRVSYSRQFTFEHIIEDAGKIIDEFSKK